MKPGLHLACTAAASALFLAACDPATPTDPEPVTTPEETATPADPAMPATGTSAQAANQNSDMATGAPVRDLGTPCGTLTADGLCGVEFGMGAEAAKAAHATGLYEMGEGGTGDPEACRYLGPEPVNYDIGYMLVDNTVQRIDIRAPGVATAEAVQVGMPEGEVEGIYPDLERQPNKYSGRDDLIVQLSGEAKLIMETDENGNISTYRVGLPPAVDYVEGCG